MTQNKAVTNGSNLRHEAETNRERARDLLARSTSLKLALEESNAKLKAEQRARREDRRSAHQSYHQGYNAAKEQARRDTRMMGM